MHRYRVFQLLQIRLASAVNRQRRSIGSIGSAAPLARSMGLLGSISRSTIQMDHPALTQQIRLRQQQLIWMAGSPNAGKSLRVVVYDLDEGRR